MICSASSLAACPRAVAPHLSSWEAGLQKPLSCCVPQEVTLHSEQVVLALAFLKLYVLLH